MAGVTVTSGVPAGRQGGVATLTASLPGTTTHTVTVNLVFSGTATLTRAIDASPRCLARFLAVGAWEPEGPRLLKVYAERFLLAPGQPLQAISSTNQR